MGEANLAEGGTLATARGTQTNNENKKREIVNPDVDTYANTRIHRKPCEKRKKNII